MAKQDGLIITLKFDEVITGGASGSAGAFLVSFQEYDMTPGGSLRSVTRAVSSVEIDGTDGHLVHLNFSSGCTRSIQNAEGNITIQYAARKGFLYGQGGPVQDFVAEFTPTDLTKKNDQHDMEHLSLAVTGIGELIAVTYIDCKSGDEHIEMSISATGVRTYIGDL